MEMTTRATRAKISEPRGEAVAGSIMAVVIMHRASPIGRRVGACGKVAVGMRQCLGGWCCRRRRLWLKLLAKGGPWHHYVTRQAPERGIQPP